VQPRRGRRRRRRIGPNLAFRFIQRSFSEISCDEEVL
jgi:hypothetical protein